MNTETNPTCKEHRDPTHVKLDESTLTYSINCHSQDKPTLTELINEAVSLSRDGDFHLEAMHGGFYAGTCFHKDPKSWYKGKTPEVAVTKLIKYLKYGK